MRCRELEPGPDVADEERDVEVAVGEPLEQLVVVVGLEHPHLGARELVAADCPMTSGNTAADVLWKVPTVIWPISPERKRSMR